MKRERPIAFVWLEEFGLVKDQPDAQLLQWHLNEVFRT